MLRSDFKRAGIIVGCRLAVAVLGYSLLAFAWRHLVASPARWPLWVVLTATVLVAGLLSMTNRPITILADRLSFGERADSQQLMRELLARMSDTLPVGEVVPRLAEAAGRTAHCDRAEVRVWLPGGEDWSHVWPSPARPRTDPLTIGVRHGGDALGEIEVAMNRAEQSAFDRKLLEELAGRAGLALSTVRLTYELKQRAADLERLTLALQQSRQRLLDARRDEQQRLQHELADRVIRHMAGASDAVARVCARAGSTSSLELSSAESQLGTALDRLRVLSRGIYPPTLSESGLAVALASWPVSTGVPAAIQVDGADQLLRDRPELEACVYFCVVTALGALADRGADRLSATVRIDSGAVNFRVSPSCQTDIRAAEVLAIRDRVEAFGGSMLEVSTGSPQSAIAATVPLALTDAGDSSVGTAGERWRSE
jgi:signal transduction histidine kinase